MVSLDIDLVMRAGGLGTTLLSYKQILLVNVLTSVTKMINV